MSIDELRAGFSRLATQTRPAADPYARLISRRRKRFRLRLAGAAAGLLAAAISAPLALQAGSTPAPQPALELNAWTKRLIDSPTRGSLASDAALISRLEQASIAKREQDAVPAGLDKTKVLLADDIDAPDGQRVRHVVVVHYSETDAYLVLRWGDAADGIDQLMDRGAALFPRFDPFFAMITNTWGASSMAVGIAPAGCVINTPEESLASARGYVARATAAWIEVWRVTCDGKEMQARTVGSSTSVSLKGDPAGSYQNLTGREGTLRWDRNGTTVVGPKSGNGPAFLVAGDSDNGVVALEPPGSTPRPSRTVDGPSQALIGTGNAYANGDVVVIRVPQREGNGAVLSGQVLVHGPAGNRAEAIDGSGRVLASTVLTDGLGYLTFEVGAATRIRVGSAEFDFAEPAAGQRIFEQPLFSRWD